MHPTGEQIDLVAGVTRAVVTGLGAGLRALSIDGLARVEGFDADATPPMGAGGVLIPWPNRIAGARYGWRGREYHLEVTEPARGHAIHGLLRHVAWEVLERTPDLVTLAADVPDPVGDVGWPGPLRVTTTYAVTGSGLAVTHSVINMGEEDVPAGVGAHPYLRVGAAAPAECTLTVGVSRIVMLDDALVPVGLRPLREGEDLRVGRRVADLRLDTCFERHVRTDELARLEAPDGSATVLWADAAFGWVQCFTPDDLAGRGKAVAVEPMTCPPNAINSDDDVRVLAPGEQWSVRWGIRAA